MCAGMARQGMRPIFAVYSTFLQRSFDMLIEDMGLTGEHVVLAVDRAGIVGRDGITHQGSFDIAYLSAVPGMTLYAPSSYAELDFMLETALEKENGPVALRYPRGREGAYRGSCGDTPSTLIREGDDVTIVCHGITINAAIEAAQQLETEGIGAEIVKINRILPADYTLCLASLRKTGRLLSAEEACRSGSVGTSLLSAVSEAGVPLRGCALLDLGSGIVRHGSPEQLRRELGLDAEGICKAARGLMNEKDPS